MRVQLVQPIYGLEYIIKSSIKYNHYQPVQEYKIYFIFILNKLNYKEKSQNYPDNCTRV